MIDDPNPYRAKLERRIAEKRMAAAGVSDADLSSIIRMLAVGAAAGDERALDRIAAAGPALREQIEASIDLILTEQQAALEQRRREAGVTVATASLARDAVVQPAPAPETAPAATTPTPMAYVAAPGCPPRLDYRPSDLPPPGTEVNFGRPPRPVPAPEFTAKRYGLKEVTRGESNVGWMGNR